MDSYLKFISTCKKIFVSKCNVLYVLLTNQITIGYGRFSLQQPPSPKKYHPVDFRGVRTENHVVLADGIFDEKEDPTRLVSPVEVEHLTDKLYCTHVNSML